MFLPVHLAVCTLHAHAQTASAKVVAFARRVHADSCNVTPKAHREQTGAKGAQQTSGLREIRFARHTSNTRFVPPLQTLVTQHGRVTCKFIAVLTAAFQMELAAVEQIFWRQIPAASAVALWASALFAKLEFVVWSQARRAPRHLAWHTIVPARRTEYPHTRLAAVVAKRHHHWPIHNFLFHCRRLFRLKNENQERKKQTNKLQSKQKFVPQQNMLDVILSMTTIPSRLRHIRPVIDALLQLQTYTFQKLILFVPFVCVRQRQMYAIPDDLCALAKSDPRFEIRRCVDDGPATKIIPAMRHFAQHKDHHHQRVLISVDDDILLEPHAVEELVGAFLREQEDAIIGFMGVTAPCFVHAEQLVHASVNVSMLGGYRGILYPQSVFGGFVRLFDEFRMTAMSDWPNKAMDDDYLLSRIAHTLRIRHVVARTQFPRPDGSINIHINSNADGVTTLQGPESHILSSRTAFDSFLKTQSAAAKRVEVLHIICRGATHTNDLDTTFQNIECVTTTYHATHPQFENDIDIERVWHFLVDLFQPTETMFNHVDCVIVSHCKTSVDMRRLLDFAVWYHRFGDFCPTQKTKFNLRFDAGALMLSRNEVDRVVNTDVKSIVDDTCGERKQVIDVTDRELAHLNFRNRPTQIADVFYSTKNITAMLCEICTQHPDGIWQCDGTNAQMDTLFGDPMPGIFKFITLYTTNGECVATNTDWIFSLQNEQLFVQ